MIAIVSSMALTLEWFIDDEMIIPIALRIHLYYYSSILKTHSMCWASPSFGNLARGFHVTVPEHPFHRHHEVNPRRVNGIGSRPARV